MSATEALQPTLWRTCRVIANKIRLSIFALLMRRTELTVSEIAGELKLSLSAASESLRLLESRGLLTARRVGRRVKYRIASASQGANAPLVAALRGILKEEEESVETVFKIATAFTHARRIEVLRRLQAGPITTEALRAATGISTWALARHLRKLEARGFAQQVGLWWTATDCQDQLRRELCRLAAA